MLSCIYRGEIIRLAGGRVWVKQALPGFNYGENVMEFAYDEKTDILPEKQRFKPGFYTEILYIKNKTGGNTALSAQVVSPTGNQTVVNGRVLAVASRNDVYYISMDKMQENGSFLPAEEDVVVIVLREYMLEGINPMLLAKGQKISAVTKGISAMSLPPQMPAHVVLPF